MPVFDKVKKEPPVMKRVSLKKSVSDDLELYLEFLQTGDKEKTDQINHIINEALTMAFNKDKEFKKFKEEKLKKADKESDISTDNNT